jgi:arylsulfatase A-like enzyme
MSARSISWAPPLALALLVVGGCGGYRTEDSGHLDPEALTRSAHATAARAAALRAKAEHFDARQALASLGPNPGSGIFFRFDEHFGEAQVRIPPATAGAATASASRFGFEFDGTDPVPLLPFSGSYEVVDGLLKFDVERQDLLISRRPLSLYNDRFGEIELRLKLEKGTQAEIGWSRSLIEQPAGGGFASRGRLLIDTIPDGEFHVYRINVRNALRLRMGIGETIRTLFFKPSNVTGDRVEIDFLRFVPKRDIYRAGGCGAGSETLGRELRPALYCVSPAELTYELEIPPRNPQLAFGTGILDDGDPVRFTVSVRPVDGEGSEQELFSRLVADSETWEDARVDLSGWAGERLEITFRTESVAGNVSFWSNPIVFGPVERRFNVIVILEDALRADHLSLYDYPHPTSPVKERFVEDGVIFEYAFSQASETRTSCPSLFTSLYPTATGVWNLSEMLDERYLTLAEILRSQGFETAAFLQNGNAGPYAGLHQGFDSVLDEFTLAGRAEKIYGAPVAEWLDDHAGRNFFLFLHLIDPHDPYDPPAPFDRMESNDSTEPESSADRRRRLYDGEIRYNDDRFKLLLAKLDQLDLRRDTLVVFLSDHGEHLGEHKLWKHKPPGYIQVLRVPLLMVYPPGLPRGLRVREPVQLLDVMPTVLELAGVDSSALLLQGDSLVPLMHGENMSYWRDRVAWSEEVINYRAREAPQAWASAFFRSFHILRSRSVTAVFDFVEDPSESLPLTPETGGLPPGLLDGELGSVMERIQQANIGIWRAITGGTVQPIRYDPEVQERLRALGYLD